MLRSTMRCRCLRSPAFSSLGLRRARFRSTRPACGKLVDTVIWTQGRHAFKAGLDLRWYQLNTVSPPNPTGSFAFTTTGTNQRERDATAATAFASFLLGQVDTFQIDLQTEQVTSARPHSGVFLCRTTGRRCRTLTLNIGARWTLHHPSTEKNNQGAVFNLATQQLDYLGRNGYPQYGARAALGQRRAARGA